MDKLREIAHALERFSSNSRVVITPTTVASQNRIWQYLPCCLHALLTRLLPTDYLDENRQTVAFFYDFFGRERITQVALRAAVDLKSKETYALPLTKREVEQLFVSMCDVRKEDIEQLMKEIAAKPERLRHLSREESEQLYHAMEGKRVDDLMKREYDLLYKVLIPFSKVHHIFLNRPPRITPYASGGDNSYRGIRRRVYLIEQMRRSYHFQHCRTHDDELYWQMRVMKRIVDEKMPVGVIVPHPHGYFEHRGVISGSGVYSLLMKAATEKTDSFRSTIMTICTRFRLRDNGWRSIRQICLRAIGSEGAVDILPKIREALHDPKAGFVERLDEQVDLLGFSLGGNISERITAAYPEKIKRMTAISSPGLDEKTIRWFADRVKELGKGPQLRFVNGHSDPIPDTGDGHIGVGCDPRCVSIEYVTLVPKGSEGEGTLPMCPRRPEVPTRIDHAFDRMFIRGFYGQHSREETAAPHHRFKIDNRTPSGQRAVEEMLHVKADSSRSGWESWRSYLHMGDKDHFYNFLREVH